MPIGLVGRKCGMTRVFTEDGESIPVTVIEAAPNRVAQLKNADRHGYRAIQVTAGSLSPTRVPKPRLGHFQSAGVEPGDGLWEFRLHDNEGEDLAAGSELGVDVFRAGQRVDVAGTSKGKGFAGTVKRHNSAPRTPPTATRWRTGRRVPSARTRPRAGYSRARRWPDTWGMCAAPWPMPK